MNILAPPPRIHVKYIGYAIPTEFYIRECINKLKVIEEVLVKKSPSNLFKSIGFEVGFVIPTKTETLSLCKTENYKKDAKNMKYLSNFVIYTSTSKILYIQRRKRRWI